MRLSEYIKHLIKRHIESDRIVVWYDPSNTFGDLIHSLDFDDCWIVEANSSRLDGRRTADEAYIKIVTKTCESKNNLLIYINDRRQMKESAAQLADPFELYGAIGSIFGESESEHLKSLALQAMPELKDQIERLFQDGRPTLEIIDQLQLDISYPLIKQALGTENPSEIFSMLIADSNARQKVDNLAGCLQEVLHMIQDNTEYDLLAQPAEKRWHALGQYVLFSELLFDADMPLPPALAGIPHANETARDLIFTTSERLRETRRFQDAYLELASAVEQSLNLERYFTNVEVLGQRDTFGFEERLYLQKFVNAFDQGRLEDARKILTGRDESIWRQQPERAQLWAVAERCLNVMDQAEIVSLSLPRTLKTSVAMMDAYTAENGWNELDNRQRLMEQSIADCPQVDDLEAVVSTARSRYRQVMSQMQKHFLDALENEGWPPENTVRQAQVFDRLITPALANREKVAFFLADALRFEMGQDLAKALEAVGSIELSAITATLPTITPVGMAALLPGADGALELREVGEDLIPFIGEKRLKNLNERLAYLQERYGDRMVSVEISDFLSLTTKAQRERKLKNADLVIVRDSRIDSMGETVPLREARRYMSDLLGDIKTAANQFARMGYHYQVITADHGHVLLPEILPGDVVSSAPNGDWMWSKRRFLLGRQVRESAGTRVFNARKLGIIGDISELVVPNGFGVYSDGSGYFHGGVSLQECILPLIVLRANPPAGAAAPEEVHLSYRTNQFTSRVLGLKAWFNSLLTPNIRVRIEVYDGPGANARKVGEAAECDARDDTTHEITLTAGQEIQIPILIEADFGGETIEVRAIQADTSVILNRLTLKNAMME